MLIKSSNLELSSKHELETYETRLTRISGQPRADSAFARLLDAELGSTPAPLLTVDSGTTPAAEAQQTKKEKDPFDTIMEMLFGIPKASSGDISAEDAAAGDVTAPSVKAHPVRSLSMMELVHTKETESCTFSASGNICLADGSTRQFDVGYRMHRSEETTSMKAANLRDPLVLDFGEPGTKLNEQAVDFDLDNDGKMESMRLPAGNSAVLFYDRNHNGVADNGSELFGPQSGNGFADLAKLDDDGNGWIDEGDAAYKDLKLWSVSKDGKSSYESLTDAEVGALATLSADTQFSLKEKGATVGQVRASSVWLGEHGGAGIVRQIDLAATPKETASA